VIRPLLLHNEEIRPAGEKSIAPGQVGFLNGWGVFSTIKVVDGVLFAFPRHFARMKRDAELMRVPFPFECEELETRLLRLIDANQDYNSTLRVCVVRNTGTVFVGPGIEPGIELYAFTIVRNDWGQGVKLGVVENARYAANVFAGTKITAWAMNLCWYEEAHQRGLDEVVLLNERGEVSECTSANLFAAYGDQVVTPPLSSGCLPGVTRAVLLEEIRHPQFKVVERVLRLEDLAAASEVFITSSTRDLLPVRSIEGLTLRQQGDPAREALQAAFTAFESAYVNNAVRRAPR
jgi:branched-chain amino acid aminotransferase